MEHGITLSHVSTQMSGPENLPKLAIWPTSQNIFWPWHTKCEIGKKTDKQAIFTRKPTV
jgi:hypothetical protein